MSLAFTGFLYGLLFIGVCIFLPFLKEHYSKCPLHQYLVWYLYDTLKYPLLSIALFFLLLIVCIIHGRTPWKSVGSELYDGLVLDYSERVIVSIVISLSSLGVIVLMATTPMAVIAIVNKLFGGTPASASASEKQEEIQRNKTKQNQLRTKQLTSIEFTDNDHHILNELISKELQLKKEFNTLLQRKRRSEIYQTVGVVLGCFCCIIIVLVSASMAVDGVRMIQHSKCGLVCGFWVSEKGVFDEILSMFGILSTYLYHMNYIIMVIIHIVGILNWKKGFGILNSEDFNLKHFEKSKTIKTIMLLLLGLGGVPLLQNIITPNFYYLTQINVYTIGQLHFPFFGIFVCFIRWMFIANFFFSIIYALLNNKTNEPPKTMDDQVIPFFLK
ncbi:Uncharacterized protein QTN25_009005 [Entamoeba marina]